MATIKTERTQNRPVCSAFLPVDGGPRGELKSYAQMDLAPGVRLMVDALIEDGMNPALAGATVAILIRQERCAAGDALKWNIDLPNRVTCYNVNPATWIRAQVQRNGATMLAILGGLKS